jgi:hypothetical protein
MRLTSLPSVNSTTYDEIVELARVIQMADQPLKYRRLRSILKTFEIHEEKKRAKGSERMFAGIVDGRVVRYPTRCHNEGDDKPIAVIKAFAGRSTLLKCTEYKTRAFTTVLRRRRVAELRIDQLGPRSNPHGGIAFSLRVAFRFLRRTSPTFPPEPICRLTPNLHAPWRCGSENRRAKLAN